MTVEKDKKKMKSIILYLDNMAAINCLSDASAVESSNQFWNMPTQAYYQN